MEPISRGVSEETDYAFTKMLDYISTPFLINWGDSRTQLDIDQWRAKHYMMLASLLERPPRQWQLSILQKLMHLGSNINNVHIGNAWSRLANEASRTSQNAVKEEFDRLFETNPQLPLMPYGLRHSDNFNDEVLIKLIADLSDRNINRITPKNESYDHVSTLCYIMCELIEKEDRQARIFYFKGIYPWVGRLFHAVSKAEYTPFYSAVGCLGEAFMDLELDYFLGVSDGK